MIGYVMVGTNDLDKAIIFYDDVLRELNLKRVETDTEYAAYAPMDKPTEIEFYVTKPFNKKKLLTVTEHKYHLLQPRDKQLINFTILD